MSEFVYANGDLPGVKADARPLVGPASKNVTAADINELTQALKDVRTALLALSPSAGVMSATQATFKPLFHDFSANVTGTIDVTGYPAGIVAMPDDRSSITLHHGAPVKGIFVQPVSRVETVSTWAASESGNDSLIETDANPDETMYFYFLVLL